MTQGISKTTSAQLEVGPGVVMLHHQAVDLTSGAGAATLMHGALQSAISSVDDAQAVDLAYAHALSVLLQD